MDKKSNKAYMKPIGLICILVVSVVFGITSVVSAHVYEEAGFPTYDRMPINTIEFKRIIPTPSTRTAILSPTKVSGATTLSIDLDIDNPDVNLYQYKFFGDVSTDDKKAFNAAIFKVLYSGRAYWAREALTKTILQVDRSLLNGGETYSQTTGDFLIKIGDPSNYETLAHELAHVFLYMHCTDLEPNMVNEVYAQAAKDYYRGEGYVNFSMYIHFVPNYYLYQNLKLGSLYGYSCDMTGKDFFYFLQEEDEENSRLQFDWRDTARIVALMSQ